MNRIARQVVVQEMKDYYDVLGLEPTCRYEDIRKAYRKLVTLYHPDKHMSSPTREEEKEESIKRTHEFYRVQEAYQILSDTELRSDYDNKRKLYYMKNSTVNAEVVSLSEMVMSQMGDGGVLYEKMCRCGASFEITAEELSEGYNAVQCSGCSLYIDIKED